MDFVNPILSGIGDVANSIASNTTMMSIIGILIGAGVVGLAFAIVRKFVKRG